MRDLLIAVCLAGYALSIVVGPFGFFASIGRAMASGRTPDVRREALIALGFIVLAAIGGYLWLAAAGIPASDGGLAFDLLLFGSSLALIAYTAVVLGWLWRRSSKG